MWFTIYPKKKKGKEVKYKQFHALQLFIYMLGEKTHENNNKILSKTKMSMRW